ncbi:kinase-like protein [Gigaspora margarita]|uniref:Kinase-like protein n=1 Tax=Gigaspora margarita TaxID=4874 RepID=A0A8H3XJJ1_GIGMA|nr:kinase-like protein [Gigaspora margarita]
MYIIQPDLLTCIPFFQDPEAKCYLLILEGPEVGILHDFISKIKNLSWTMKIKILKDIAYGLKYLQNIGIVHRNLSTRSIFMGKKKIQIENPIFFELDSDARSTISLEGGIAAFIDPEPLKNQEIEFTAASDIYSFGVIMWSISSGKHPFEDSTNQSILVSQIIANDIREQPIADTPAVYLDLYQKCWDSDSKKRPTIHEVCKQLEIMSREKQFNIDDESTVLTFDGISAQINTIVNKPTVTNEKQAPKKLSWIKKLKKLLFRRGIRL